jgi:hypothetical protein
MQCDSNIKVILNEDKEILGYIRTNLNEEAIIEVINESIESNPYNYDVDSLIKDIIDHGFEAERVYLDEIELI